MEIMMKLYLGKMEEQLKHLEDNTVDSIVTDPPYHLTNIVKRFGPGQKPVEDKEGSAGAYSRASKGFMGKEWDGGDIAFRPETWEECLRVLKPGGHIIAFSGSRTYHRMAVAIEDAGFEIRDQIMWVYGSGFPKSLNIGKKYDKKYGIEREDLGANPNNRPNPNNVNTATHDYGFTSKIDNVTKGNGPLEGWGTALKPAHEPMVLARKPLSEKTVLDNCEKWGVGAINVDASRVGFSDEAEIDQYIKDSEGPLKRSKAAEGDNIGMFNDSTGFKARKGEVEVPTGRWPANFIHDGSQGVLDVFEEADFPQAGKFFYVPKVNKKDRNEGLEALPDKEFVNTIAQPERDKRPFNPQKNTHPTVKPTELMHYLIRMVTPAGGVVLDPFMGSGSTGKAAIRHGFDFIGIEMEEESYEVAKARIEFEL